MISHGLKHLEKKLIAALLSVCLLAAILPLRSLADGRSGSSRTSDKSSVYCWSLFLMNEGSYPTARSFLRSLNVGRIYQEIPSHYLGREEIPAMIARMNADGIETVALSGDRAWGLEDSDLSEAKAFVDGIAAYNTSAPALSKISSVAFDIETYTYRAWKNEPVEYFRVFIDKMKELYAYTHAKGLAVVQVIPVHFDTISTEMLREFVSDCCDEISLMNYDKATQVEAIEEEVALCRELGIPVETIFETMPYNDNYSVTEENTYYYEGIDALNAKKDAIFAAYGTQGLSVSYHHLDTVFHVATGKYIAEIYAYTDGADPNANELGQTEALKSIILKGDDGSEITAGLYNPNRGAEYEECCYLAYGISPGVTYTIESGSVSYTVPRPTKTFAIEEDSPVVYTYINIKYTGIVPPEPEIPDFDFTILGASIRISEPYGIRFGIQLGKTGDYGTVPIVEYGTLLKPARLLGSDELTLDTPDVLRIPGKTIYSESDTELVYTGVLINIPEARFDDIISGRGYLIYEDENDAQQTLYTDTVSRSFHEVVELAYAKYAAIPTPTEAQLAVLAKLEALRAH